MTGNFIDTYRYQFKKVKNNWKESISLITTEFGQIRMLDTLGEKPVILNVPDGPNVIEHHQELITKLSKRFRVICFEFPGIGFSYPNSNYDYSFPNASKLIINLMDILKIEKAALAFSCSNGFYAIKAAELFPLRINRLFLSQTSSLNSMSKWTENAIPKILKFPVIGQIANIFSEKKFAKIWYKYALPKHADTSKYQNEALNALNNGGCFCLSSLVQGLSKEVNSTLKVLEIPATLIWGSKDFTHKNTDKQSIMQHLPNCEIIEFDNCGHFPELEDTDKYVSLINERMEL
ncbi:alpha/beta fold hydrolase [uncultured Croceitalea sp.]|uniref:alpha/beta fold hydrolase n=1 Tax=uncultured Croceitalea sp. TaxID=1798908 RepID=UPI00374E7782